MSPHLNTTRINNVAMTWSFLADTYTTYASAQATIDINFSLVTVLVALINFGYYALDWYLNVNYCLYSELEFHRKRYVIKNILKAMYLSIVSLYVTLMMICFVYTGVWSTYQIHNLGIVYMLPDLISLIRVPKLDRFTVQHHISVVILASLNLFCDYSENVYWRGMVVYAYMSTLTGIVNFYLGYRLLTKCESTKREIAGCAFFNYLVSIIVNWSYQVFVLYSWLFTAFPLWGLYVYITIMYFVVKDDIILLTFLQHNRGVSKRQGPRV